MKTILFVLMLAFSSTAHAFVEFHQVSPGVYRGSQPNAADIAYLKLIGIQTIIDLNDPIDKHLTEEIQAKQVGIKSEWVPLSGFWAPKKEDVEKVLALMADKKNGPIYLHCEHGHDRTGLLVGLYRVRIEHVSKWEAWKEMFAMHFHPILLGLSYFWITS